MTNRDAAEIAKFDAIAKEWWDPNGPMKPLHDLNALRLSFIKENIIKNQTKTPVLDIGCGGGILTERLAREGFHATGIDLSEKAIHAAKKHAYDHNIIVNYHCVATEAFAKDHTGAFDVITCMEMLEHVPDPNAIIHAAALMLKPGGQLFFSTLNRNPKSFFAAIIGAEYIFRLLPRGTHDYHKFIRPSELTRWAQSAGLTLQAIKGITYHPFKRTFELSNDVSVNYLMCFTKRASST